MNAPAPIGLGILGCGHIAAQYVEDLLNDRSIQIVALADLDRALAEALAQRASAAAHTEVATLLDDPRVELVANLTSHHAHYELTRACLEAGRHVFSEKPLAMSSQQAWALVDVARAKGVRLAGAPMTFLGDAQQTALKAVREGRAGDIRLIYAEMNHGWIERWHPAPASFYQVGPLWDVGVYPLMLVTAGFGPARRVRAAGYRLLTERRSQGGVTFPLEAPDWAVVVVELEAGPVVRMTANFYVEPENTLQQGVEFHGDGGSVHVDSAFRFNAQVRAGGSREAMSEIGRLGTETRWIRWGRGIHEMVRAMHADRPHPCDGAHAAHIVDILEAADHAMATAEPVDVDSTFPMPEPMLWAQ